MKLHLSEHKPGTSRAWLVTFEDYDGSPDSTWEERLHAYGNSARLAVENLRDQAKLGDDEDRIKACHKWLKNNPKPDTTMNELNDIYNNRALREARALHQLRDQEMRAENRHLRLENKRLKRELRAANRGNQRLSLAIKAGRALSKAQARVEETGAQRIGIDMADDGSYRLYIVIADGVSALRGPDGEWSHGWKKGLLLRENIPSAAAVAQIARDMRDASGIPCVGECDPPSIIHAKGGTK